MWYIGNFICQPEQYDGHHGIYLQQIDPGRHFSSAASDMFCGTEYRHRENGWRHRIFIIMGDWYYLMVAEGGTLPTIV